MCESGSGELSSSCGTRVAPTFRTSIVQLSGLSALGSCSQAVRSELLEIWPDQNCHGKTPISMVQVTQRWVRQGTVRTVASESRRTRFGKASIFVAAKQ